MSEAVAEDSAPARGQDRVPLWLWPNLLSLDAPLVAVAWQWLFAVSMKVKLPTGVYLVLGLTVWIIYTVDRLFDAERLTDVEKSTARHRFHRKFHKSLLVLVLGAVALDAWLIYSQVARALLVPGLFAGALVAVYFLLRFARQPGHGSPPPREILCGFAFAGGTVVSVYFYGGQLEDITRTLHPLFFALLCVFNCLAIAAWERESDEANDDPSTASARPNLIAELPIVLLVLAAAAGVLQFTSFPDYGWSVFTGVCAAALALALLIHFQKRFSKSALRVLADVALLTPLVIAPLVRAWMRTQ
jgi:hypothetical protein